MKFFIYNAEDYTDQPLNVLYPVLNNYGFENGLVCELCFRSRNNLNTKYMAHHGGYITVDSIEQLLQLQEDIEYRLIVSKLSSHGDAVGDIEIYDGYRE